MMRKKIEVYADWQPAYMGDQIPMERYYFDTLLEARPKINELRKTACGIRVSEMVVIEEYVWGKKKKTKQNEQEG